MVLWLPGPVSNRQLTAYHEAGHIVVLGRVLGTFLSDEHDWPTQTTKLNATGWAEKVITVSLLVLAAYVAYEKAELARFSLPSCSAMGAVRIQDRLLSH